MEFMICPICVNGIPPMIKLAAFLLMSGSASDKHRIMFIYLETEHGGQLRYLSADGPAEADFSVCEDKPVAAYAYCNKHGLWRIEL